MYDPWVHGIQCAFIFCSEDNALPFPMQKAMAGQFGPDAETYTIKSGHCPYLSIPDQLLEALEKAAVF